jgi:hypothetical protein
MSNFLQAHIAQIDASEAIIEVRKKSREKRLVAVSARDAFRLSAYQYQ